MSEPTYYIETHRLRSAWIVLAVLTMIVISCMALDRSTSSDKPYYLVMIALLLIAFSLSLVYLSLVLIVTPGYIILLVNPLRLVILKLTGPEIASFNLQRIRKPPREPFDHRTKCFLARWSHGLLIRTSKGQQVLIGTPHPEKFMRAVWKLKKRPKSSSILFRIDA